MAGEGSSGARCPHRRMRRISGDFPPVGAESAALYGVQGGATGYNAGGLPFAATWGCNYLEKPPAFAKKNSKKSLSARLKAAAAATANARPNRRKGVTTMKNK